MNSSVVQNRTSNTNVGSKIGQSVKTGELQSRFALCVALCRYSANLEKKNAANKYNIILETVSLLTYTENENRLRIVKMET